MKPYCLELELLSCYLSLFFKCMSLVTGRCFILLKKGTEACQYIVYSKSTCRVIDNPEIFQFS